MKSITSTVGMREKKCINNKLDVITIQELLLIAADSKQKKEWNPGRIDGLIGPSSNNSNTVKAILAFQKSFMNKPDGVVSPMETTINKLNQIAAAVPISSSKNMNWEFIHIIRRNYQNDDHWGEMFIKTAEDTMEMLCYTYELPWDTYESGTLMGKSKNNLSRIKIGTYDLKPRSDGPKGWRLELQNTGHRSNIQIHRAHTSMFIQGCILPVNFNNLSSTTIKKGDPLIQQQSVALMNNIKNRYEKIKIGKKGNPLLTIAATLPAKLSRLGGRRYA